MNYTGKGVSEAIDSFYKYWTEEEADKVIALCLNNPIDLPMNKFLESCTACGGNWGGMLLSGIHRLRPEVWEAIPDVLGGDGMEAFACICEVLYLLKVKGEE